MPLQTQERPYTWDSDRSRCAAVGSKGRCQLRGSIGHAAPTGGHWYCAWHDGVINLGEPSSLYNFTEYIKEQKEYGCTRWDRLTIDAWWSLIQGETSLGCWDWRKKEDPIIINNTEEERPGYE
jgi:hypothetical protein